MKTGLLGYPIDHSLSPAIHTAAYKALGLDWHYSLYPCPDNGAFETVLGQVLKDPGSYVGLNVTTPYKAAAFKACSDHSSDAHIIESANVITVSGLQASGHAYLKGDNTDGYGLITSLEQEARMRMCDAAVVLCGTGSVAMAALLALLRKQAARVTVVGRDAQIAKGRVNALLERLASERKSAPPSLNVIDYGDIAQSLADADVLIDATTLGMKPADEAVVPIDLLRPGLVVYDVVYGHGETALVKGARQIGARAYGGVGMLVEQAARTIEIWAAELELELKAPRGLMLETAYTELLRM